MRFVDQTATEEGKGNCFSACLASLLEVGCEDIPSILDYPRGKWFSMLNGFLREHHNCVMVMCLRPAGSLFLPNYVPFIASGDGGRGWRHAVIMQYEPAGLVLLHDPHPSRGGINGEIAFIAVLVKL